MKKISLAVASLVLYTSAFSDSITIDDAFKNGEVEGTVALYGQKIKSKDHSIANDLAYGNGHLRLAYTTDSFYGFNAKIEAKGNLKLGEKHKRDYKDGAPFENNALFTQAYLQYELDNFISIKAGRYEGEYEWLTDYQQGAVAEILAIPDTVVALGYSNKKAESGIDLSEDFHKPELTDKGVYFIDIQNKSIDTITFNPYYYEMPDFGRFYGLKAIFDADYFGITAQYAKSNADNTQYTFEDENGNSYLDDLEDGSIAHIEGIVKIEDFEVFAGYAKTDKDGGANMIASFGDTISPFEDGDYVYDPDAKTWYIGANYSIAGVELSALYGITKHGIGSDLKTKELNLSIGYGITDSLGVSFMYVNVDNKNFDEVDYNKYIAAVEYNF
ncbi:Opr family porin [Aliarcobacter lanthieri]|uniref:Opr family porin n=1 Tax=Aliarcobacter lanthieri TaxID=1355374 RepID=UPI00047E7CCD|nr:Opr family porin [Aliarcobacter lanthieri]